MKHQPLEILVDNLEELNRLIEEQNFMFAKGIVEGILKNINTDIPEVHLLVISVKSENATYDITVNREDFAETLEENLPHYIREEEYEQCRRIANTIEKLKEGNLSKIITDLKITKDKND